MRLWRMTIWVLGGILLCLFQCQGVKLLDKKRPDSYQHNENTTYLKSLLDTMTLHSFQGVYQDENGIPVYLKKVSNTFSISAIRKRYNNIDISQVYQYYDLIDFTTNSALKKWPIVKNLKRNRQHFFESTSFQSSERDTLLVYTTCNHVNMSIHSLESISSAPDLFDILVIDDHSIDGTVHILTKKGFSVISKPTARGLTDSWNIGYYIATLLKYKYIIFSNNDVLVPHGTIEIVRAALRDEALVVPLTTRKGAGHNPTQSIETQYSIDPKHVPIFNNPSNFQLVQNMLTRLYNVSDQSKRTLISSKYKGKQKFNGFFFAINIKKIESSAYNASHLFDPNNVMVEQEDTLMASMSRHKVYPKICKVLFVYHYKSVTVKAAGSTGRLRNNLHFFHPEITKNKSVTAVRGINANVTLALALGDSVSAQDDPVRNPRDAYKYYRFLSQLMDMDRVYPPHKDTAPKVIAFVLPPSVTRTAFMIEIESRDSDNYNYTRSVCNSRHGIEGRRRRGNLMDTSSRDGSRSGSGRLRPRVRKVVPTCCGSKVRQDMAAAIQLSHSLQNFYDVKIKYLFESSLPEDDWHDLSNVDLVINMAVGAYQLDQVYNLKSTLVKAVWIIDVFDAWSDIRSIGNYDLILAPSEYAKSYIHNLQALPSLCLVKCPRYLSWAQRQSKVLVVTFPPILHMNYSAGPVVPKLEMDFIIDVQDSVMEAFSEDLVKVMKEKEVTWGMLKRNCKRNVIWKYTKQGMEENEKIVLHESLHNLFRSTKVIILKISPMALFNGLDPFIFDALVSGAWVLLYQPASQPLHGLAKRLPVFSDMDSLLGQLELYMTKTNTITPHSVFEDKNNNSSNAYQLLRQEILEDNSNFARAALLSTTLKNSGMMTISALSVPIPTEEIDIASYQTICIGITTSPFNFDSKEILALRDKIIDLIRQFIASPHKAGIRLHIYVLQPMQSSTQHVDMFKRVINECEKVVFNLGYSHTIATTLYWNNFYVSDEYFQNSKTKKHHESPLDDVDDFFAFLHKRTIRCDWCMLSHMNWTHTSLWMDATLPLVAARNSSLSLIAWDFMSSDRRFSFNAKTHLVTVGPSAAKICPWVFMFRMVDFKDTHSRFIHLEYSKKSKSLPSTSAGKAIRSKYNDNAFVSSMLQEVSQDNIVFLHSTYPLQLMNDSTKKRASKSPFNYFIIA